MKEIRWHGRGGQGAFTASKILGAAAVLDGSYALAFPSFGPERRGAPIQAFTKIDDSPITDRSVIKKCDYIIYLDETLYQPEVRKDLKDGGKVLINSKDASKYPEDDVIAIDGNRISEEILGRPVSNTVMLAALAKESKLTEVEKLKMALEFYLPAKIVEKNKKIIQWVVDGRQ